MLWFMSAPPGLYEVGAGMMLWPNATRVLKELGVLDRVVASSGPNTNFLVRSDSGKILMNIALGRFDVPALCARRADLLSALLSRAAQRSSPPGARTGRVRAGRVEGPTCISRTELGGTRRADWRRRYSQPRAIGIVRRRRSYLPGLCCLARPGGL